MNYLLFICSDGKPGPEKTAVMRREVPAWVEEMDGRGVRLLGRALGPPERAATVRMRDGETLVTDGPFMETKEFMAGLDLLECADLDEAIEVAGKHPVSWFNTVEIRPFVDRIQLGEVASAFGLRNDSGGTPFLLATWMGGDAAVMREGEAWRQDATARGVRLLGNTLQAAETATTVRVRDGETLLGDGPFTGTRQFIAGIDVVRCADWQQAIDLASAHPMARSHAIEVRRFDSE